MLLQIRYLGFMVVLLFGNLSATEASSAEQASSQCAEAPPMKARARERFEGAALMIVAKQLESQGEANFHLKYAKPASHCIVEAFSIGDASVTAGYSPWLKGLSTLLYRFTVSRSNESSEILVLYDGMASLMAGGGLVFHVSEERQGVVSWYGMFAEEPAYPDIKALVDRIVRGDAKPLLAVTWPKGAKEGELVAYDAKRLK